MALAKESGSTTPAKTRPAATPCRHCGTPFRPSSDGDEFCCAGCEFVYHLIRGEGLDRFYELRGRDRTSPIKPLVFRRRDWSWVQDLVKQTESVSACGPASAELEVQGISCIGCVWLVERLMGRTPGVVDARVHPALGRARIRWTPGAFDAVALARDLQSFGYLLGPTRAGTIGGARRAGGLGLRLGLCGAFALNTMLFTLPRYLGMGTDFEFAPLFGGLAAAFSCLSFVVGGSYFITRSWNGVRRGALHIDLPISLGLVAAFAGSWVAWFSGAEGLLYFDFVSVFVFLMILGRWLQEKAIEENRRLLLSSEPGPANFRLADGTPISSAELSPGHEYALPPGEPAPVRSRLLSAAASLAMDWISGESDVRDVSAGQLVPSGAVNVGRAAIVLRAKEAWGESVLASLLNTAPREAIRYEPLERFIRGYTAAVLVLASIGLASWWGLAGDALTGLQVFISVLVVSCPCASGVAVPLLDELAASGLRRFGVFIRDIGIWARLRGIRKIAFDKTGTLTEETLRLIDGAPLAALDATSTSALIRMVSESWHPVCDCLRRELLARGGGGATPDDAKIEEIPGKGISLQTDSGTWRLGRPDWVGRTATATPTDSSTDCDLSLDGKVIASFRFRESIRDDAVEEATVLRHLGHRLVVLSGDRTEKLRAVASRLGIAAADWRGGMSPADKAAWIRENGPGDTMMVGDGANDSLAFDASRCCGTPAIDRGLLERKADFYYLGRGISGVRRLIEMGRRRDAIARAVIGFAIAYNIVVVAVSLAGRMNPLVAAIVMPLSSLASLAIVFIGLGRTRARRP